jgi:hypothetical protein
VHKYRGVACEYSRGQTARVRSPAWGLGVGLTTLNIKYFVTTVYTGLRTRADSLDKRPKLKEMDMRFGTWNVRSLYGEGALIIFEK